MADLKQELKELIITSLDLDGITSADIKDDEPLFGAGLELDSIDALELGIAIKKKFGITFSSEGEENKKHFASVNALSEYITAHKEN